jgi:CBS domain-containing protein
MLYLTQILGKSVLHPDGERLGRVAEVVVSPTEPLPTVSAYQVRTGDGALFVPAAYLPVTDDAREYTLTKPITDVPPYQIRAEDFSLVRDVQDRQIVDVHDFRVVRVNDIALEPLPEGPVALYGVDAGVHGLLRRLGIENAVEKFGRAFGRRTPEPSFIAWPDVASLPRHNAGEPLRLRVSADKIAQLHPADIGSILNHLDPADRKDVIQQLDTETAAEALAEADEDVQVQMLQHLDAETAADIIEEMDADEAADVLKDLDAAHREEILEHMEAEEREDVEELLPYADSTAGGLMTNEYVAMPQNLTAQQAIDRLREMEPEAETIYYVYVVDEIEDGEDHLVGVISLRDLIVAKPDVCIGDFMIKNAFSVPVDAHVEEVAHLFERYKLLALPVVDDENRLQGIITIDDTLEQLLPPDWRRRSYGPRATERSERSERNAEASAAAG